MRKKDTSHPYKDPLSFERLMLLIATLLKYPGIGCPDGMEDLPKNQHHNALTQVQLGLRELANVFGIQLPANYPSTPTLRKDLETLRHYGILDRRMYRWGYYLGTGVMSQEELKVAIDAIASQAKYQGDSQVRRIHETLSKRLRGLDLQLNGEFFYPIRQYLNRAIVHTDPEEMAEKGNNQDTLFHKLPILEQAIIQGQPVEISRSQDLYGTGRVGPIQVLPLQLIYYDIAWYLLYEYCDSGHLAIGRMNRFKNYCKVLNDSGRGTEAQRYSLGKAYELLENGWGLNLGEPNDQQLELQGKLEYVTVKVRFFHPLVAFIQEGELRHPNQEIISSPLDEVTGKVNFVDYIIALPPRSLNEFLFWVYRYMDKAQVLAPPSLVQKHHEAANNLVARF
ncbi:WYL domain-containing protein [Scytonema sp. UIC 10036]|uniref:helix-turn-helix transcriptional regulator n=1 Tax=Scytonema sp. UIC 10036 TaxID=2304196 RepID=UPI0012DA94B0|nr:WYL domain-containing protein [Scytonema sp. UIC 10036]MUG95565.1 WYL domain-containing protein [Scytonema sp. UIC 10036]